MQKIDWEYARRVLNATDIALEQPLEGTPERIASMYRQRAERLARSSAPVNFETSTTPVLVFRLDKEHYGIELSDISAVLGVMRCTPVPESEAKLEGLINVNGTIRPVLNLRFILDLPAAAQNIPGQFLLLRQKQRELGLKVDELERIHRISLPDLNLPGGGATPACIRGFTSDTLTVLRTSVLFSEFWTGTAES